MCNIGSILAPGDSAAEAPAGWCDEVTSTVVKLKLGAACWTNILHNWDICGSPEGALQSISKALTRLWPKVSKSIPEWVAQIQSKAAAAQGEGQSGQGGHGAEGQDGAEGQGAG